MRSLSLLIAAALAAPGRAAAPAAAPALDRPDAPAAAIDPAPAPTAPATKVVPDGVLPPDVASRVLAGK